jgi:hypothetical protein
MSDYQEVEISREELIQAMRTDCVTSLSFYLGEELSLTVPEFHIEIWEEMVDIVRTVNLGQWVEHIQKLFCVPRGFSKTTVIKVAVILFMRYSRLKFTLYASRTTPMAKNACRDIYHWFIGQNDQNLHGKCSVEKANETDGLWILDIGTPDFGIKRIYLKALGSDQQVRGTNVGSLRPDLMIIDDVEDNNTSLTPESQAKLDTWLMGNLLKAAARRSVRIILGNMINSRTMLYRFSKDPAWRPTVFGAIVRDKESGELRSLWPELYSLDYLIKEYKDYRSKGVGHVWVYEMMNMTADTVFKTELLNAIREPRPLPDMVSCGIITVDPAFGEKSYNDFTALTVHVRVQGSGIPHVVESRYGRWDENRMLDNLIELSQYWNLRTWGIESVAAQKLLIPLFRLLLKDRQFPDDLIQMLPLPSGGKAKSSRILAFAKSVGAGSYGIVEEEEELYLSLENYDPASTKEHDDLPDSAAYGLVAWADQGELIKEGGTFHERFALLSQSSEDSEQSLTQAQFVPF